MGGGELQTGRKVLALASRLLGKGLLWRCGCDGESCMKGEGGLRRDAADAPVSSQAGVLWTCRNKQGRLTRQYGFGAIEEELTLGN